MNKLTYSDLRNLQQQNVPLAPYVMMKDREKSYVRDTERVSKYHTGQDHVGYYELEYIDPIEIDLSSHKIDSVYLNSYIKFEFSSGKPEHKLLTKAMYGSMTISQAMRAQYKDSFKIQVCFPRIKDTPNGLVNWDYSDVTPVVQPYSETVRCINRGGESLYVSAQNKSTLWNKKKRNYKTDIVQYEYLIPHRYFSINDLPMDFDSNSQCMEVNIYDHSLRILNTIGYSGKRPYNQHTIGYIEFVPASFYDNGTYKIAEYVNNKITPVTVLDLVNEGFDVVDIGRYVAGLNAANLGVIDDIAGQYIYSNACIKHTKQHAPEILQNMPELKNWISIGEVYDMLNRAVLPIDIFVAHGKMHGLFDIQNTLQETRIKHA